MTNLQSSDPPAAGGTWPADGLVAIGRCPVCGDAGRSLFLDRLRDTTFYSAPGEWTLWRCGDCRSLYLDPRPTPETLGLAYRSYYTHAPRSAESEETKRRGLRAAVVGHLSRSEPAYVERLPVPEGAVRPRLLDIGCGNGEFLLRAKKAGWEVSGCDFDPVAVEAARESGAEVRIGGAEVFRSALGSFDAVTLGHVIEHVGDPGGLLALCLDLLKPGGAIFVDTPNTDARGLQLFGRHWRGLEPPRHLVLFNWEALEQLMIRTGFERLERLPQKGLSLSLWLASDRIRSGLRPETPRRPSLRLLAALPLLARLPLRRTEFITLRARKPA